jgi:hypothetical protein
MTAGRIRRPAKQSGTHPLTQVVGVNKHQVEFRFHSFDGDLGNAYRAVAVIGGRAQPSLDERRIDLKGRPDNAMNASS